MDQAATAERQRLDAEFEQRAIPRLRANLIKLVSPAAPPVELLPAQDIVEQVAEVLIAHARWVWSEGAHLDSFRSGADIRATWDKLLCALDDAANILATPTQGMLRMFPADFDYAECADQLAGMRAQLRRLGEQDAVGTLGTARNESHLLRALASDVAGTFRDYGIRVAKSAGDQSQSLIIQVLREIGDAVRIRRTAVRWRAILAEVDRKSHDERKSGTNSGET